MDILQTILIMLIIAGLFPDRPRISIGHMKYNKIWTVVCILSWPPGWWLFPVLAFGGGP